MASGGSGMETCMLDFSLDLYRQITKDNPAANACLSPVSVMVVMAMVYMGAAGNTLEQMTNVLRFEHLKNTEAHVQLGKLIAELKKDNNNFTLKTINRLYPNTNNIILQTYINDVSKHFLADTKSMDYTTRPEESRLEINDWVKQETNGKIKDLLAPDMIYSDTALVLVNAIYFKGSWATEFEKEATRPATFFSSEVSSIQVDMMHMHLMEQVGFSKNDKLACTVLELPYKGEELSMLLLLPDKRFGLKEMEAGLTAQVFDTIVSTLRKTTVQVSLPKFKLETSYKLNDILQTLGMTDLFDPMNADLSRISKTHMWVSHVVHKAFVDLNEEGTKAAAATADDIVLLSAKVTRNIFRADHPFMFVIYDKRQKVPLFMGRVVSPTSSVMQQGKIEL